MNHKAKVVLLLSAMQLLILTLQNGGFGFEPPTWIKWWFAFISVYAAYKSLKLAYTEKARLPWLFFAVATAIMVYGCVLYPQYLFAGLAFVAMFSFLGLALHYDFKKS